MKRKENGKGDDWLVDLDTIESEYSDTLVISKVLGRKASVEHSVTGSNCSFSSKTKIYTGVHEYLYVWCGLKRRLISLLYFKIAIEDCFHNISFSVTTLIFELRHVLILC